MDRCGQLLEFAANEAVRRYGEKALVSLEKQGPAYPERERWCARVKVRGDTMCRKAGPKPEVAARLLAHELASITEREYAVGHATLIAAAEAGV